MREFRWIADYFAPLASLPAALNLRDDAAVLSVPAGQQLVISTDTLNEAVHFLPQSDPFKLACKTLAVNLSDLAAMGAEPLAYSLALSLPHGTEEDWVARFAAGLAQMQQRYGLSLLGGDTTATHAPLSFTITIYGLCENGRALMRSGARPSDELYVTGHIGAGLVGLHAAKENSNHPLRAHYECPTPRIKVGRALVGVATACMDVSDGLIQDAGHLAAASGLSATLMLADIPLPPDAEAWMAQHGRSRIDLASSGDDYELLFTAPAGQHDAITAIATHCDVAITRIGTIAQGSGVQVLDESGAAVSTDSGGWQHF